MHTPLFIIKWTNYEYWPWWFFYIPLLPYWLYLALKTKSLAYFTATNTNIELGGFFGESKIDILEQIGSEYKPKTFFVPKDTSIESVKESLSSSKIQFPIVAKPNVGERGFEVEKIIDLTQLEAYHQHAIHEYIIQEFVTFDLELGVLFCRMPDEEKGKVTSVTIKEFLTVTGDGKSSILQLMEQNVRARFQIESVSKRLGKGINQILKKDEEMLLEPIGNHCRGTRFVDGNHLINPKLNEVFNRIALPMTGFYYGRFDLKVKSLDDLYKGENIRIMELNGASSEPGHIYDARNGIVKAYRDLAFHWNLLADISIQNQNSGIKPVPFKTIVSTFSGHFWK
jgi:hypothetical protein